MTPTPTKADRSRALRYKKPALQSMGYDEIVTELSEMSEKIDEVAYFMQDKDSLVEALDGDEDDAWEFQMMFSDLSGKAEDLLDQLRNFVDGCEAGEGGREFDDCTVALLGRRYRMVGFDDYEEDYFALCGYDEEIAVDSAAERLMRKTKREMLGTFRQSIGILVSFLDLRYQYDYMRATIDILTDENHSILEQIKEIEQAYEDEEWEHIDRIVKIMPDRLWVE